MVSKLIIRTVLWIAAMAVLLFVSAGTLRWPGAWIFLAEVLVLSLAIGLWLNRHDPGLLRERMGSFVQRNQTAGDRIFMIPLISLYVGWLVLMALDAQRFGWSSVPVWAQALGALGIFLTMYVCYLTFRENSFAAPVIKIQAERGHRVVTTGPYAYVRHPMYAGALLFFVGVPLLLGSWWGLALAPLLTALLVFRIGVEERTLRAGLPGYREYAARVRYRLIPLVW